MIKIPDISQIRKWDEVTIQIQGISSIELMERAANQFVKRFSSEFKLCNVLIICGTGNNGGDGLAIARMLNVLEYHCQVCVIQSKGKESEDFLENRSRLSGLLPVQDITDSAQLDFKTADIVIDALFGSGLSRKPEGLFKDIIERINNCGKQIISVDVPSGLLANQHSPWASVCAHKTFTFQVPKLSFLLPEGLSHTGEWSLLDIALDPLFEAQLSTTFNLIQGHDVKSIIRPRAIVSHKGNFGHALIFAGSRGMMGAAVLAVRSALRAGAGRVTAVVPACGYDIIQSTVPESMVLADAHQNFISATPELENFQAIGIGPGISLNSQTQKVLHEIMGQVAVPMVIDADALNIISINRSMLSLLNNRMVLTPHPGEFRRLVGDWKNDFERLRLLKEFSSRTGTVVVLKGPYTAMAFPNGEVYFNSTGNPFMATAGSGDILTGLITSFLAQGHSIKESVLCGVYLHGLAGDLASQKRHPILAGDIISHIPNAWDAIFGL